MCCKMLGSIFCWEHHSEVDIPWLGKIVALCFQSPEHVAIIVVW